MIDRSPRSMRVMLLAPGDSLHSQRFLQWLQEAGCQVYFVDRVCPPNLDNATSRFLEYPRGFGITGRLAGHLNARVRPIQLRYLWFRVRPDIVHVHWVDGRAIDCYRARLRPLVLSCWGSDINNLVESALPSRQAATIGKVLGWADLVFGDSRQVLDRCDALARRPVPSKILYFGIDIERFSKDPTRARHEWRCRLGIPDNARVILSIRALKKNLRHELIVRAFAIARQELPFPTVLVLKRYNPDAEERLYESIVQSEIARQGVSDSVRWIDSVPYESIPELYLMADLVVNFPAFDAFPVSFFEAAAAGTPVVSSRLPAYFGTGVENVVELVVPESVGELARAMVRVLQWSPEVKASRTTPGRQWVHQCGAEDVTVKSLFNSYRQLLLGDPSRLAAR